MPVIDEFPLYLKPPHTREQTHSTKRLLHYERNFDPPLEITRVANIHKFFYTLFIPSLKTGYPSSPLVRGTSSSSEVVPILW